MKAWCRTSGSAKPSKKLIALTGRGVEWLGLEGGATRPEFGGKRGRDSMGKVEVKVKVKVKEVQHRALHDDGVRLRSP